MLKARRRWHRLACFAFLTKASSNVLKDPRIEKVKEFFKALWKTEALKLQPEEGNFVSGMVH